MSSLQIIKKEKRGRHECQKPEMSLRLFRNTRGCKKKGGKQRQDKVEKRLKETERKRKYRNKVKTNSQTTPH